MTRAPQLAGVLLLLAAPAWCAGQKDKPAPQPKAAAAKNPPPPKAFNPNKGPAANGGVPRKAVPRINNPGLAQRLLQMSPEERDRALEKLPPDRQEQVRKNLEKLDRLPQAEKDHIAAQAKGLDSLPADKRKIVMQQLNAFNKLPDDRIRPVRRALMNLMGMPEEQREKRLNSEAFKNNFSPQEQSILRDLSRNLPLDYLPGR